jgi:hypothetical protein
MKNHLYKFALVAFIAIFTCTDIPDSYANKAMQSEATPNRLLDGLIAVKMDAGCGSSSSEKRECINNVLILKGELERDQEDYALQKEVDMFLARNQTTHL